MLGALGLSLVVVHFAAVDDDVETVMLQRVKQARFMSLKAEGPIKEGEKPPFVRLLLQMITIFVFLLSFYLQLRSISHG
jgi:hypothetical protein